MGGAKKKAATDGFFTDRLAILKKVKRPIMVGFFAYCWYKGWVGRFGFLQGAFGSSYFDMLGVPLRVLPGSPFCGSAFFQTQLLVDTAAKLVGFLINLARGKAKIPSLSDLQQQLTPKMPPTPPGASPWATTGSPWPDLTAATSAPGPGGMPTASTTPLEVPPLYGQPFQAPAPTATTPSPQRPPSRTPPPTIDADVRFLD